MKPRTALIDIKSDLISLYNKYTNRMTTYDREELGYILDMINYCLFEPEDLDRFTLTYVEFDGYRDNMEVPEEISMDFKNLFNTIFYKYIVLMNDLGLIGE